MKKIMLTILFLPLYFSFSFGQSNIDKMFPNLVMTKFHFEKFKEEIAKPGTGRLKMSYVQNIKNPAEGGLLTSVPKPVVSLKNNPDNIDVQTEMQKVYRLCVAYLFTENDAYLNKAVEHLLAWAAINKAESKYNIHESVYAQGIEGYSIIRNIIDEDSRTKIDNWIKKRGNVFVADNDLRMNNWGTCLMHQLYSYGLAIGHDDFINWYKTKYPTWVKNNLFPNGTTTDLLGRDAFAYHAYDLLFFAKLYHATAMYNGYAAADEFYKRDVNWGASIEKCVHFWTPFMMEPEKYTHIEFTNTEWAPDLQRNDANKPFNPFGHLYAIDELFEMDYDNLKPVIDKYRGGNIFATWPLTISSLRWEFGDN